ncbi:MAG: SH3 domain-containing protein [Alkalinema sp. RU_4_3]|nr:SH3 domain-containing protein [Alkalinema sp. RU_4_3]
MKRLTAAATIVLGILVALGVAAEAQQERSWAKAPELQMMMNLDRQAGLEQIFKSTLEKPMAQSCPDRRGGEKMKTQVFVKFDLVDGKSRKRSLLFEHSIGTNLATYWVYDIREVRNINRDEYVDLVFYAGDDTSDETVLLLRKKDHYKAIYAGNSGFSRDRAGSALGETRLGNNKFTRWDAQQELLVGEGVAWTNGDCIPFRKTPDDKGEMIFPLYENNLVELLETKGSWQKIRMDGQEGWVEGRLLSRTSPTKLFYLK